MGNRARRTGGEARRGLRWPAAALVAVAVAGCEGTAADAEPAPEAGREAAALAEVHAGERPTPTAAVGREGGGVEVTPETVVYAEVDGRPVQGFLARPAAGAGGPGILLVHEWWGLNDNLRDLARQLASHGYTALAVDLYGGESAQTPEAARALVQQVSAQPAAAEENLRQAHGYLRERAGAGRVGVIGWCFGGGWALRAGLLIPELDAVVMYYGSPITERERLQRLDTPLLGIFGAKDPSIPVTEVRAMESTLRELGKPVTVRVFEDAGHAFANPSGERYVASAAEEAWQITLDFLAEHLKQG